jgi:hypothetical protein
MSYRPAVYPSNERRNPSCRPFEVSELIERCFRDDILPSRVDHPSFKPNQIFGDLYIPDREWIDPWEPPSGSHPHEDHLQRLFWTNESIRRPICLLGELGVGKSTLIDYYLRCHCPTQEGRQDEFSKKLIIHFDAGVIFDNHDFYHLFFQQIQSEIRFRCAGKMDIESAIRGRSTQPQNVRQWVWAALEEMSKLASRALDESSAFRYIVVVVDNLDQTDIAVQIRAITEVEQWLRTSSMRIWRAFLPMWPETYIKLRNSQYNQLRDARTFLIGPIRADDLLTRREQAVQMRIQKATEKIGGDVGEYLTDLPKLARAHVMPRIDSLTHGNLRHKLAIWKGLVTGEAAHAIWRQQRNAGEARRPSEYDLLDALIVGSRDALANGDHRIVNLFGIGHAAERPRDILIGAHALYLLDQERTGGDFRDVLAALGYNAANIKEACKTLKSFNLWHEVPDAIDQRSYKIHTDVVSAYRKLLEEEPAYLDNVAMVTAVDPKYHSRMFRTRVERSDDFTHRVSTTMAFLEFLRDLELQFSDPSLVQGTSPEAFSAKLVAVGLPCLWRKLVLRYRERIEYLSRPGYLPHVEKNWWDETLAAPLFSEAVTSPDVLRPLVPQGTSGISVGDRTTEKADMPT